MHLSNTVFRFVLDEVKLESSIFSLTDVYLRDACKCKKMQEFPEKIQIGFGKGGHRAGRAAKNTISKRV